MIGPEYNGKAILIYTHRGREDCWLYINTIVPERFKDQVISAVKLTASRGKK